VKTDVFSAAERLTKAVDAKLGENLKKNPAPWEIFDTLAAGSGE